jgi:hypothetical protein
MLIAAAALLLASCSSGKKSSSGTSPTTGAATATTRGAAGGSTGNPFCDFFRTFQDQFGRINPGLADPQQLKPVVQQAAAAISQAQSISPPAIQSDVAVLADGFQKFVSSLQSINFDFSSAASNPQVLSALSDLNSPEYAAASQHLDAYLSANCA